MREQFERWRVADLEIDVGSQSVARNSEPLPLPRLSYLFLLELVRAAPNVLTNDDLMARVWPGIFVNSETVTQRAKLLRDALGDDPKNPRYFAARRGVGYQLVGVPERLEPGAPHSPATGAGLWRAGALVAALGLALAGGAYWFAPSHRAPRQPVRVAVLPFDNLSADPADAYIAQGIPEMVLSRLAPVSGLEIVSRESALLSGAGASDPGAIARTLDADYIVRGSVQKQGDTLRVTSFVVDAAKGTRLWSQSYDWPVSRVYALQDRISGQVSNALSARVPGPLQLGAPPPRSGNPDAYLAFLKGKALLGRFRVSDTEAAAVQFQRAVDLDPSFAQAMVALYDARMQAASLRSEDLGPVRRRYASMIERAGALDPQSAPLLYARAMWSDMGRDERIALFEKAMKRDPSNSRGLIAFAQLLEFGRQDGPPSALAQQLMDRVMANDPLSADAQFWSVQRKVFNYSTPQEVAAAQRKALQLDPGNILLANRCAVRRWRQDGETAEAIMLMERILATDPQYARNAHVAFAMYLDVGSPAAARAVAASTPATRDSSRAVLARYSGDWRAAGEAALAPRGFLFNQFENWLWPEIVRDFGLRSGQHVRAAEAIATRYGFDLSNPRVSALHQSVPSVPLAQLLAAQGRTQAANRLLAQSIQWIDAHPRLGLGLGIGRAKAQALMLLGNRDQALSVLLATVRHAHDIRHCWYLIGQDPVWTPVRGDPRFREVAGVCDASLKAQRLLLDRMRREGKVPGRAV